MRITSRPLRRSIRAFVGAGFAAVACIVVTKSTAGAAVPIVTVTNCNSTGAGSLPDAITTSNAGARIVFGTTCPASDPIVLTEGTLEIDKDLSIIGPGASNMVVDGGNEYTVFQVDYPYQVKISDITIDHGSEPTNSGSAGGVNNFGTLTVTGCVVSDNEAAYAGGGINNFGSLILIGSAVTGNSAAFGGGISNEGAAAIFDSTITDDSASNGGGGIASSDSPVASASLRVSGTTLSGNTAEWGAGIANEGTAWVANTDLSSNSAGAGVGGGLFNETHGVEAKMTVTGSTIASNTGSGGGGLFNYQGAATVTASTFRGNTGALTAPYVGVLSLGGTLVVDDGSTFS